MTTEEQNLWETSSGLVDMYVGDVGDAYFAFDDNYNNGDTLVFKIEFKTDDPDVGDEGTVTEMYPCGAGWDTTDKGKSAHHESGKPKKFNKNSGMGLLIDHAIACEGLADELMKKGQPNVAETWHGLKGLRIERVEFEGEIDGEKRTWARMLPTEYLGASESKPATKAAGKKAASKKAASKPEPEADDADDTGDDAAEAPKVVGKLKVTLIKLAKECDTHDDFVERAFTEVDEVDGDENVQAVVMDDSETGLYETARS